jgi:large subunit ribosomal protein L32
MPPLPKKKRTQSRKRSRWSHSKLTVAMLSTCPQCQNPKLAHRVCSSCGFYAGRDVLSIGKPKEGGGES